MQPSIVVAAPTEKPASRIPRAWIVVLALYALGIATARPADATSDALLATPAAVQTIALEDFDDYPIGSFPRTWKARGNAKEAAVIYRVAEDNDNLRFLAARAEGNSVMIGLERPFEPARYPYLRWRWRVRQLPTGADERSRLTNDSAAGVYVVFPGRLLLPRVLKYVWSSGAPVGMRQSSPAASNTKIIVVESGPVRDAGKWRTVTVNVQDDYAALFGSEVPAARGIGLLTDANDTGSVAAADYAGFELLTVAPADPVDAAQRHGAAAPSGAVTH